MKNTLIVAASALSMISAPAFAQSTAASDIGLSATVAKACGVGNHLSGAAADPAGDQSDIAITDLVDANGQFKVAKTYSRSFGNVWCNGPATVTIAAEPLATNVVVGDTGSFTNRLDLAVSGGALVYVGGGALDTAVAGSASKQAAVPGAFETGLRQYSSVDITVKPTLVNGNAKRPVAGSYTGKVTFTASVS